MKATPRQWAGLAVIALPCMLYSMDLTVLNLAVPSLSADLKPSASQLLWIVDIYGFMVAGWLITMGNLGDRIGRRRLLLIGAAAFGVTSALAAFSGSASMLIATRALLGIAGATLAPSTLSLIRNMFDDPHERSVAIGVWISSYSVGAAIGPVLGGVLLEHFWWGSVFLINVPVMVVLLVLGPRLLPEFRDPAAGPIDLPSAALSIAAVLTAVYGLKRMAEHGIGGVALTCVVAGLALGLGFVRRQGLLERPLVDLRLFRIPAFSVAIATYMLSCVVLFGTFILIAQQLQLVLGLAPLAAGLWTVPSALAFVVGSLATPLLTQRMGNRATIVGGLCLAAAGLLLLVWAGSAAGPLGLAMASVIQALGLAPVITLATELVVGTAPSERAGAAAAVSETSSELGGALGIAILGSLGAAIYRIALADAAAANISPEMREAARNTLGQALEVSRQLGGLQGDVLLNAARGAFVLGLKSVAAIGTAVLLGAAWLAARFLQLSSSAFNTTETARVLPDAAGHDATPTPS